MFVSIISCLLFLFCSNYIGQHHITLFQQIISSHMYVMMIFYDFMIFYVVTIACNACMIWFTVLVWVWYVCWSERILHNTTYDLISHVFVFEIGCWAPGDVLTIKYQMSSDVRSYMTIWLYDIYIFIWFYMYIWWEYLRIVSPHSIHCHWVWVVKQSRC